MKKQLLLAMSLLGLMSPAIARNITPITVSGDLTGQIHWTNDKQYLLSGYVYVDSNAVLTIDSGVTVFGDKTTKGTLIIERGAQIFANGTKEYPIVFTSNEAMGNRLYGDWGGVIICGRTPTSWQGDHQVEGGPRSLYGGTNLADNSGRMTYCRIEFGGIPFSANNEVNSLSLYAVGSATQLDHIQCSYNGDDAFEWFGGSVNAKYLVSYKSVDDDFDNDLNFSGKNQFGVAIREPYIADAASGSKSMECDAYQGGTYSGIPYLNNMCNVGVWSNLTLVGPQKNPGTTAHNSGSNIAGIQMRRGAGLSVLNSIVLGWPVGILFDEAAAVYGSTTANLTAAVTANQAQFRNLIITGTAAVNGSATVTGGGRDLFYVKDGARNNTPTLLEADTTTGSPFGTGVSGPYAFFLAAANGNRIINLDNAASGSLNLTDPFNLGNPNLLPMSGSPALSGANFTTSKASDTWFTPTTYVGAFGAENWMAGWTNFNPINTDYDMYRHGPNVGVPGITSLKASTVYPNPAANYTSVSFELMATSNISLGLYDVTGKMVKELFAGSKASGSHLVSIDLSNVEAGYYFVRLATAEGQRAMPLSVIK